MSSWFPESCWSSDCVGSLGFWNHRPSQLQPGWENQLGSKRDQKMETFLLPFHLAASRWGPHLGGGHSASIKAIETVPLRLPTQVILNCNNLNMSIQSNQLRGHLVVLGSHLPFQSLPPNAPPIGSCLSPRKRPSCGLVGCRDSEHTPVISALRTQRQEDHSFKPV